MTSDPILEALAALRTDFASLRADVGSRFDAMDERLDAMKARLGRVEDAIGIGSGTTQPLSGRVDRMLTELVDLRAEVRAGFTMTRTSLRQQFDDEAQNLQKQVRELAERVKALEERGRPS